MTIDTIEMLQYFILIINIIFSSSKNHNYSINGVRSTESTVDLKKVEFFEKFHDKWWDSNDVLALLHDMNRLRVQFVRDGLANTGINKDDTNLPLKGMKIADIGCGGGIFSEPLARLGAEITGIDKSFELINIAKKHASLDSSLSGRLNYIQTTIEEFEKVNKEKYDVVVASEILEYVFNQHYFLQVSTYNVKRIKHHKTKASLYFLPLDYLLLGLFVNFKAWRVTVHYHHK